MSHGINILQSNGQLFDENIAAVTFIALITVGADASGALHFPEVAGMSVIVSRAAIGATAFGMHDVNVTYGAGYPIVNYYPTGGPAPHTATQLMIFAR